MAKIDKIQEMLQAKAAGIKIREAVEMPPMPAPPKEEPSPSNPKAVSMIEAQECSDPDTKQLISRLLIPEIDYGIIQGCRKPSLFKAGAEKLAAHFDYHSGIEIMSRTECLEQKYVAYEVKVTLTDKTGQIVAEGVGAANSHERRYLKGDFYSFINTVLKMAKKRAYVDAVLTATATSGVFTQDMEDIAVPPDESARKIS